MEIQAGPMLQELIQLSSEWLVYPNETWTYLGTHNPTCQTAIYGCTDSLAINFDSTATVDDGSCIFRLLIAMV